MSAEAELASPIEARVSGALTGRWFVGHTQPRKEHLAQTHLECQGFRTFLPNVATQRRHARKAENVRTALFPRYLFICVDLARDRWRSINGTLGMSYLVTSGPSPCPVPPGFVEALRAEIGIDPLVARAPELSPGDKVRLNAGPFARQVGELLRLDPKGRVELLLELLNGAVRVNVAQELLETTK